jgi:hypothetical protein
MVGHRHVDKVAAWQGNMTGKPGSFGAQWFLTDLYQYILPFSQKFFDIYGRNSLFLNSFLFVPATSLAAVVINHPAGNVFITFGLDIVDIEKTGPFKAQIDKGCLHARQNPYNTTTVDIADHAFFNRPLQVELNQVAMFDQGNADFI